MEWRSVRESNALKKGEIYIKKLEMDFSMQSFWAACIASALCNLGFETGIVDIQGNAAQLIISILASMVVFFLYWWYRLSKVTDEPSFGGYDVFAIIFGSFVAQWAGVAVMLLSPLFGGGVEPISENNSEIPVFYQNCDEAREYGAAPVYEDDPGYSPALDRDGDGVGCETWYGD